MFSPLEWIIILLIVVMIFGAGKLPQAGDALGRAVRNFRKASSGDDAIDVSPRPAVRADDPVSYAARAQIGAPTPMSPPMPAATPTPVPMAAPAMARPEPAEFGELNIPQLGARQVRPQATGPVEDASIGPELTPRRRG